MVHRGPYRTSGTPVREKVCRSGIHIKTTTTMQLAANNADAQCAGNGFPRPPLLKSRAPRKMGLWGVDGPRAAPKNLSRHDGDMEVLTTMLELRRELGGNIMCWYLDASKWFAEAACALPDEYLITPNSAKTKAINSGLRLSGINNHEHEPICNT